MDVVTLRVVDGADRGQSFNRLDPPFTIGREEGNGVQLNDERISRYHAKIQFDKDRLILTDLESTNGTRVNGEQIQIRVLKFGDIIQIGKTMLLYGTREQIAKRLERHKVQLAQSGLDSRGDSLSAKSNVDPQLPTLEQQTNLHTFFDPPGLPADLSPGQAAEISDLIEHFHIRLRGVLQNVVIPEGAQQVAIPLDRWQALVELHGRFAEILQRITGSDDEKP